MRVEKSSVVWPNKKLRSLILREKEGDESGAERKTEDGDQSKLREENKEDEKVTCEGPPKRASGKGHKPLLQ